MARCEHPGHKLQSRSGFRHQGFLHSLLCMVSREYVLRFFPSALILVIAAP